MLMMLWNIVGEAGRDSDNVETIETDPAKHLLLIHHFRAHKMLVLNHFSRLWLNLQPNMEEHSSAVLTGTVGKMISPGLVHQWHLCRGLSSIAFSTLEGFARSGTSHLNRISRSLYCLSNKFWIHFKQIHRPLTVSWVAINSTNKTLDLQSELEHQFFLLASDFPAVWPELFTSWLQTPPVLSQPYVPSLVEKAL